MGPVAGMPDDDPIATIDGWIRHLPADVSEAELLDLGETAMATLWHNAHLTLGTVTLAAIVARVLATGAAAHPCLKAITVDAAGVHLDRLEGDAGHGGRAAVAAGLAYFLGEWLSIIGALTADILTPTLLADIAPVFRRQAAQDPEYGGE